MPNNQSLERTNDKKKAHVSQTIYHYASWADKPKDYSGMQNFFAVMQAEERGMHMMTVV